MIGEFDKSHKSAIFYSFIKCSFVKCSLFVSDTWDPQRDLRYLSWMIVSWSKHWKYLFEKFTEKFCKKMLFYDERKWFASSASSGYLARRKSFAVLTSSRLLDTYLLFFILNSDLKWYRIWSANAISREKLSRFNSPLRQQDRLDVRHDAWAGDCCILEELAELLIHLDGTVNGFNEKS